MKERVQTHVPGPFRRAVTGIIVREGRFYWSGFASFWRIAVIVFVLKLLLKVIFALPGGLAGAEIPVAAMALTSLLMAGVLTALTSGQRSRFNAAAPPVPATTGATR
ncbi:MAG TPA: hypothetical protein VGC13_13945 [Longimicrobium sp.]|jgi:hypothetical protein|uniref:hypothetical protein n=1 Tax=Longimicrobium sp. TaxID=2029185 RepID=UPI002ED9D2FA